MLALSSLPSESLSLDILDISKLTSNKVIWIAYLYFVCVPPAIASSFESNSDIRKYEWNLHPEWFLTCFYLHNNM